MFPAARIGDLVMHDGVTPAGAVGPPLQPPLGGVVMIEGQPAAHVMCTVVCSGAVATGVAHPPPGVGVPPVPIILGSPSVLIGGNPAARWMASGDIAACGSLVGDMISVGMRTVFIGMGRPPLSVSSYGSRRSSRPLGSAVAGFARTDGRFTAEKVGVLVGEGRRRQLLC